MGQGMSIRQAALKYGVPRRTVDDHASGKILHFNKSGVAPMLSEAEEEALVEYIEYMASHNMPLKRNDLRGIILVGWSLRQKKKITNRKIK